MVARRNLPSLVSGTLFLLLSGCGGELPPPAVESGPVEQGSREHGAGMSAESEIGGMDDTKVRKTFHDASDKLTACYKKGTDRVSYLAGDVEFQVRVTKTGTARWVLVKDSTLGDHETESCMIDVLKGITWPKPLGGEGLATNSFNFEPEGDERKAVTWTANQLGPAQKTAKAALTKCMESTGVKNLKATLYVETDGTPSAIGIASTDERGGSAADCAISALRSIKFPSPGSFAAKATLSVP